MPEQRVALRSSEDFVVSAHHFTPKGPARGVVVVAGATGVAQRYYRAPETTLVTGLSNGGYLVRWQLENHPELYDGGVDWEGTLWSAEGPNLVEYLPTTLSAYPRYAAGGPDANQVDRLLEAHFAILGANHHAGVFQVDQILLLHLPQFVHDLVSGVLTLETDDDEIAHVASP